LVAFFRPDGVGMLRVLTVDDPSHAVTRKGDVFRGLLDGKIRESNDGKSYRRTWALSCRGRKPIVSYSCAAHNAELEREEVDAIVQSISEIDATRG